MGSNNYRKGCLVRRAIQAKFIFMCTSGTYNTSLLVFLSTLAESCILFPRILSLSDEEWADPWQDEWVLTTGGSAILTADVTHNSMHATKLRTSSCVPGSCSSPHPGMLWEFSGISTFAQTGQSLSLTITCCVTRHQNPQWKYYNIKCGEGHVQYTFLGKVNGPSCQPL